MIAAPDVYGRDPTSQGWAVAEDIDEPLGRHWDLLVEEQGVWWWGDGYPTLDEHPEMPASGSTSMRSQSTWPTGCPHQCHQALRRRTTPRHDSRPAPQSRPGRIRGGIAALEVPIRAAHTTSWAKSDTR